MKYNDPKTASEQQVSVDGAATRHAAALARATELDHPNIARVYEVVRPGAPPRVETEHTEGISLDELLHETRTDGPPPIEVIVSILGELARAIDFIHARSIVHGDINPIHLFIADGRLKLFGFGAAHLEGPLEKRCYQAPESIAGAAPTPAADLYSLGVIAYELVTGQPLFDEHMDPQLRGAGLRPPSHYNPDCPPELDDVILGALSIDPDDRWGTASELCRVMLPVGAPNPNRVIAWLGREREPSASAVPQRTLRIPTARRRVARGSGRLPSPRVSVHEEATAVRASARDLRFPLEPPLTPPASQNCPPVVPVSREPVEPAESDECAWLEYSIVPAPTRSRRQYIELAVAFLAGVVATCAAIAWLG